MSEHHEKMTKTTPMQVVAATVGGLVAPLIAIFLVVQLVLSIQASHAPSNPASDDKSVEERIKPVGSVRVAGAEAPEGEKVAGAATATVTATAEKTGEQVFNAICTACHTSGALNAPKFGNKGDWAPRIAQGYDTLVKHAIDGIRAMPPRGGSATLSDVEVERAVAYMADAAGAKFSAPK